MDHVLFNPGPEAVVYTPDGRVVDAQERVLGNPRSPIVKKLLARDALVDQGPKDAGDDGDDGDDADDEDEPVTEEVFVDDDADAGDSGQATPDTEPGE